jgi:hypothetical protein
VNRRRYRTDGRASRKTIADRLTTVDAHAAKLVIILSEAQTDDFGIVHIERRELADLMDKGISTVAQASAQLRAAGWFSVTAERYLIRTK